MIATALMAIVLAAEIAIVDHLHRVGLIWFGGAGIYYVGKPSWTLMIAVAAVPALITMIYPGSPEPEKGPTRRLPRIRFTTGRLMGVVVLAALAIVGEMILFDLAVWRVCGSEYGRYYWFEAAEAWAMLNVPILILGVVCLLSRRIKPS
jgi:hypothetical protein